MISAHDMLRLEVSPRFKEEYTAREILEEALYHITMNDEVVWIQQSEVDPVFIDSMTTKTGVCSIGAVAMAYHVDQSMKAPYIGFAALYNETTRDANITDWTCECSESRFNQYRLRCENLRKIQPTNWGSHVRVQFGPNCKFKYPEFRKAAELLLDAICEIDASAEEYRKYRREQPSAAGPADLIARWNDGKKRRRSEVIHAFEVAIKKAIELESTL